MATTGIIDKIFGLFTGDGSADGSIENPRTGGAYDKSLPPKTAAESDADKRKVAANTAVAEQMATASLEQAESAPRAQAGYRAPKRQRRH